MKDTKQKLEAKAFAEAWKGKGYEKGQSQSFWLSLLRDVYGVAKPEQFISFEDQVKMTHTSFIDGYIADTRVLIEQKSIDKDLREAIKQSDGTMLNPFQQAKRYITELPVSKHPRWVVTCNFKSFLIYDMEQPQGEPFEVLLENLPKEFNRLNFLVDVGDEDIRREMRISLKAGEMVGKLYDAFLGMYGDDIGPGQFHSVNALCVRLVFCLYAEDAGVFEKDQFYHYMSTFKVENMRIALQELFHVLDTPIEERDPFLEDKLKAFPYVNGYLFRIKPSEFIPPITESIADLLLNRASKDFDWSEISPTIFGAVFESTLNPDTRRKGGMHYTSIENIHKVIDPLFLDDLKEEFETIKQIEIEKKRKQKLEEFQDKLASLRFFDPACGSGNFLTESYMSIRRLENKVIEAINKGQTLLGFEEINPIKVSIKQFFGIEINDFAVTVATTALWIAEAQMMTETERIIQFNLEYLPLKRYSNIHEANALRVDWKEIVPYTKINYIMGNPPFVGMKYQDEDQKKDMAITFQNFKNYGSLDYVSSWFYKAAQFAKDSSVKIAFVSTNSIVQGEQAAFLWSPLLKLGINIDFAYPTFKWDSESNEKAAVHCVIIGFSYNNNNNKRLFLSGENKIVKNINPYLLEGPNIVVESRTKPLCNVPKIVAGNKPVDGDFLKVDKDTYEEFKLREPKSLPYIKKLVGGYEFINKVDRYVLWLVGVSPSIIKSLPMVYDRVNKVREARLKMKDAGAKKLADTPTTFRDTLNPDHYIVIPIVSSMNRRYVPMGFLDSETIPTNQVQIIPNADIYCFGILESNVHMAWMRLVCGRLKSDYRYTAKIVYNNFPWPTPSEEQKQKIEETAQAILDARDLYPDCSLADLYDEVTMPPELRKAHQQNDRAVMQAYGFPISKDFTESTCVAELFKLYAELVK